MPFDINNNFTGSLFGHDRMGHTTPDAEATETFRPYLPNPYPAPYLPIRRVDSGHPVLAGLVFSSNNLVGLDKNNSLVSAGLFCGSQATKANGGKYCAFQYSANDVSPNGFTFNALTGNRVASPTEVAVLAAPSDGVAGDVITFENGLTYTVTAPDLAGAAACNLFPNGRVRPIGMVIRNAYQYIGGVTVLSTVGGMSYTQNGVQPAGFPVLNFKYEMGIPVQTEMVVRLPWIGATETTLQTLANADGVQGFTQNEGRSYVHFVGTPGPGLSVVANQAGNNAGNYTVYNPAVNTYDDIVGRIWGVQQMYPIVDGLDRVRTLFDPNRLVGPIREKNPAAMMMGGSATNGIPYPLSLTTDGIFPIAFRQNKPLHPEYYTYVLAAIRTF